MMKKRSICWTIACSIGILMTISCYIYYRFHFSKDRVKSSVVTLKAYSHYELRDSNKLLLSFDEDTVKGVACFVDRWAFVSSCGGRAIAVIDSTIWVDKHKHTQPLQLLSEKIDSLEDEYKDSKWKANELDYYIHSHNVTDEGYSAICQYADTEISKRNSSCKLLDSLKHIKKNAGHLRILHQLTFALEYQANFDTNGNLLKHKKKFLIACKPIFEEVQPTTGTYLFQIVNHQKPVNVQSLPMDYATGITIAASAPLRKQVNLHQYYYNSLGCYSGETNKDRQPEGYGIWHGNDGNFYEGNWKKGKREGFGFSISPNKPLRVGEWKDDKYKGEKLVYTSERIYGIDISKYQHNIGKKKYPINWNILRITHLGNISRKTVNGNVNFPIRYIYVKSTEGATMLNPYYRQDYIAARAHGYKVGSYHFFSTISSAGMQARQFLKYSFLRKGDLPPVLDVEPTKEQIKKMGGIYVLFARMRVWLRFVEREAGVKPILYINQTFVNRYLNLATDLKHNYQIWIARYGEYKPDVHLVYWQLCPDGRVRGIHGEVDINVFNGYQEAYDTFISTHTVS